MWAFGQNSQGYLFKTCVKSVANGFFVEILADKDQFNHAVAVFGVPVTRQTGFLLHEHFKLLGRSCREPETGLGELFLHTCLLEKERHVAVMAEIDHALAANHVSRPFGGDEMVELVDVEAGATIVHKGLNAILLRFAFAVMVVAAVVAVAVMTMLLMV